LYSCDTLLEGLAEDFQDGAAALRELIEKHKTMVRQRHLAWHGDLTAAHQPSLRNRCEKAVEASAPVTTPAGR
jgi:hypothetical protein